MPSSASGASPQQLLQILQTNHQNNYGLIGDGSNNIVNSGNTQFNQFNITATAEGEGVKLDKLLDGHISKDALHNSFYSPPECHPNTRTTVRNEIGGWIEESGCEKSPLLWLNGPAAVGKSVIAKTVSGFHDQIVATFFFSTSSDKSAATLFPTLAWQLAQRIPDTKKHIVASLKKGSQASQIEEQFNRLIIQPLKSITALRSRPIMVIDGVDECTDEDMLGRFLRVLVQAGEAGHMPVRFIICSRPEVQIRAILGHDLHPTTNEQKPQLHGLLYLVLPLLGAVAGLVGVIGSDIIIGSLELIRSIRMFGIYQVLEDARKDDLLRLIRTYGEFDRWRMFGIYVLFALLFRHHQRSAIHHRPLIQPSRGFLQDVWELYRPIRLGVDTHAPAFPTSNPLADMLDTICPHPVISTIQIGFSEECKDDIARYLTDKFNDLRRPGEDTGRWFQPSDISELVKASCGQFLYASTIVRLLDNPHFHPRDVIKMARRSSLPTPDLNGLYKAILKRARDTIRNQAKEGGPDYQTEWQFVADSLAILVFFEGNDPFFTVQKSFSVIEILLGLEKSGLNKKLCKMHSVLRIVPGESVSVYHRSFLEFLSNRRRSGEYHVAYSNALRWTVILMIRAGLRYGVKSFHWRFK